MRRYKSYNDNEPPGREQDRQQARTFLAWWNSHLSQHRDGPVHMDNLFEDIKTGIMPIKLLEVLSGSACGKVRDLLAS
jgi:hypothetical protein